MKPDVPCSLAGAAGLPLPAGPTGQRRAALAALLALGASAGLAVSRAAAGQALPGAGDHHAKGNGVTDEIAPDDDGAHIRRGRRLQFPRDHGSHNAAQTEWWYATGHLAPAGAAPGTPPSHGFQVTFFRSRTGLDQPSAAASAATPAERLSSPATPSWQAASAAEPARLAPRQILFAHAALTRLGDEARHVHDQRLARWNGVSTDTAAHARRDDLGVALAGWQLRRDAASGHYLARLASPAQGFALDLQLRPTQPLLLQGDAGFSRKGPREDEASHYTSHPQLAVQGRVQDGARSLAVQGQAWLDHEWSNTLLAPEAQGWDWVGFNLADGSALTAFQIRRRPEAAGASAASASGAGAGAGPLWAGGSWRRPGQAPRDLAPGELRFEPLRWWTSRASGARYPVAWRLHTPMGRWLVQALLDAQELDSSASTGAIYWEGLSALQDERGQTLGLGYLEMTGYARPLRLSAHSPVGAAAARA